MADEKLSPEQERHLQSVLHAMDTMGRRGVLVQYCTWANLHIDKQHDQSLEGASERAQQLLPLIVHLSQTTGCTNTEELVILLRDSTTRALFSARRHGRTQIQFTDADEVLNWIMAQTEKYR